MLDTLIKDLRYGLRLLAKEPLLTAAAALSIAIGVAANTTVFSVANKALFQGIPVGDPDTLVSVYGQRTNQAPGETLSKPDFEDLRAQKDVFQDATAYFLLLPANIRDKDGRPMRLWGQLATPNYFRVAQLSMHLGRGFAAGEGETPGKDPVVVLSHHLWRDKLGADASIVGREIQLNQYKFTVVGVAPPGFRGMDVGLSADFWVPMSQKQSLMPIRNAELDKEQRGAYWLMAFARLQPGVSIEKARAAVKVLSDRLQKSYPDTNKNFHFYIERAGQLNPAARGPAMAFFGLLLVVMTLVLLIACANVANLLMARAAARHREISTRLAIGAPRSRLVRQLLTESALLAMLGGGLAILFTKWAVGIIANVQLPIPIPVDFQAGMDWRVGLFTLAVTVLTSVAFGLMPALRATRQDVYSGLRVHAADAFGSSRRFSLGNLLVAGQVAAAALLLIGSVLFLRSLQTVHSIDLGLNPNNLMIVAMDPVLDGRKPEQAIQLMNTVAERTAALPGVTAASYIDMMPLSFGGQMTMVHSDRTHSPRDSKQDVLTSYVHVGEHYLAAMGIRPIAGESTLRPRAGVPPVIVNQSLAEKVWPNQNPMGQTLYAEGKSYQVVGVAATSKQRSVGEDPSPAMYMPLDKESANAILGLRLLVRTAGPTEAMVGPVREAIRSVDPDLSIYSVQTMNEHVANAQVLPRMAAWIFGFAGAASLVLAVVGLYGVISYSVSRRYREIGIRMALGAEPASILRLITSHGMRLTLIGTAVGVVAALGATRVLANLLYGISATDPVSFGTVPAVLLGVALAACLAPAVRASRMDPSRVLREE